MPPLGCPDDGLAGSSQNLVLEEIEASARKGYSLFHNTGYLRVSGLSNYLQEDFSSAESDFTQASPQAKTYAPSNFWIGLAKECQGDLGGTVDAWRNIGMIEYLMSRGQIASLFNDLISGITYQTALRLCPNDHCDNNKESQLWFRLGSLYFDGRQYTQAEHAVQQGYKSSRSPEYEVLLSQDSG